MHFRRHTLAGIGFLDIGVGHAANVAARKSKVLADLAKAEKSVFRGVVTEPVAAVIGEPKLLGDRVKVKALGIAHAGGNDFHA